MSEKLGCLEVWWLGGIYSPNHQSGRWEGLLSMGAPDSPVRQPRHPTVRVRLLELWHVGPLDSLVVHWTGTVYCPVCLLESALTLHALSTHCSCTVHFCRWPLALLAVAPHGTTDSPVLHRTFRWIIAEWLSKNPKLSSSEWISLVHRTLSDGTPDSLVRQTRSAFGWFCSFLFEPFLGLFIGLCWTFGTCRTYSLEQTS
jgi:hypothetical protein